MRLYTYDITEGDKGIIFANSYEEAVELFKNDADYSEIEIVEEYGESYTCVICEFADVPTEPKLMFMFD